MVLSIWKTSVEMVRERRERGDDNGRYKGVRMRKWGKWVAEIRQPNSRNRIWLGSYNSADEAARAYDAAVLCLRGPSATFNFPSNMPEIPATTEVLSPTQIREVASRHARRGSAVELAERIVRPGLCEVPSGITGEVYLGGGENMAEFKDGIFSGAYYQTPGVWAD
ncbi:ETHYLENE-RESPONSIVE TRANSCRIPTION FACTOR ERF042-RELATED [Salix koriyanagi]|uniref:ETHYLENE-RESPONSIVE TRANSCRIPTION FACTOR ERF042-RELATED n=1 Tax=Salix koriyanagi TaxID=2511006 RepID=A0A9Q1A5B3_9ROSI|nr:ETHYLENE-RESPONSIVE TRANSCRIPTION FACTOR ERF042-RELATED [Salix koriyanagi]KAJ6758473.1 ETHYLENE-RESPONSIVE TRANSCRIPTION FACTOR ERF042-RELATED [Salix koriyanagi]